VRALRALGAIAVLIAAVAYFNYGTLSPCGALRETVRQRDGLAAILPDSIVDLVISGQYGALSPGRCISILLEQHGAPKPAQAIQQPIARQQTPQAPAPQDALQAALKQTELASDLCRAKRLRGELPTYAASVRCANPAMIQAFKAAQYRYMDLIDFFAAKRLELAEKIDRNELTEDQAKVEGERAYAGIVKLQQLRDGTTR
jgi:hypothetical protein